SELSFSISPCWRTAPLGLCAAATLARLSVRGYGVDRAQTPAELVAALGAQVELFSPVLSRFGVLLHAQALATLTPQDVTLNHTKVWSTAPLVIGVGLALPCIFR
ncbi:MAG TPA: hypothetical protein VGL19_09145, partial [Polyangiaceae bacterium]